MLEVAKHYELFDGISPINTQNRALLAVLIGQLNAQGPPLAVYWGNRNWHPLLDDVVCQMAEDGVQRALALVTSAFGSYPGCRQYLEDIERARQAAGPNAPQIDKLRLFYNHPGFVEAMAESVSVAFDEVPAERRADARLIYVAHSLPIAMGPNAPYERQLREACLLVTEQGRKAEGGGRRTEGWQLAFQSRSGPPSQPWLEPDIRECIRQLHTAGGVKDIVVVPLGFLARTWK